MSIMSDRWIKRQCQTPVRWGYVQPHSGRFNIDRAICGENDAAQMRGQGYEVRRATDEEVWEYEGHKPMIWPFEPKQVRYRDLPSVIGQPVELRGRGITGEDGTRQEKIISYGTSSYGYDIRCADEFKVFTNVHSTIVDPKNFDPKSFVEFKGDSCIIPPNSFALARTVEYFRIPRDVLTVCLGKSTYARCGIIVNVTPFEPEWEGYVTLEFSNTTPLPAKIYANEGCAQVLFFKGDEPCEVSYRDRGGKYQGQSGVVEPRM